MWKESEPCKLRVFQWLLGRSGGRGGVQPRSANSVFLSSKARSHLVIHEITTLNHPCGIIGLLL